MSEPCSRVEKKSFEETHQFYTFHSKNTSPWGDCSHEIYNFLSPYQKEAAYKIWSGLAH